MSTNEQLTEMMASVINRTVLSLANLEIEELDELDAFASESTVSLPISDWVRRLIASERTRRTGQAASLPDAPNWGAWTDREAGEALMATMTFSAWASHTSLRIRDMLDVLHFLTVGIVVRRLNRRHATASN